MSMTTPTDQQLLEHRALLELAGGGVIYSRNGSVERCNAGAEALLGWPAGALAGQRMQVIFPDAKTLATVEDSAAPVLASGGTYTADVELSRRDGTRFLAHLVARFVAPDDPEAGTLWIVSDVTAERGEAESSRRLQREQQLIFDRAAIGIAFVRDRIVQRCNRRFEEMFGFAPGEAVGQSTRAYFCNDIEWRETGEAVYRSISQTGAFHGERIFCRKDGTPIWCRFSGTLLDPDRPELGYVWLHEDVTEQHHIEQALNETRRQQELVFDNAMIGISYQCQRTITRCNRRLEEIFGHPPGSLAGQSTRVLFASDEAWREAGQQVYQSSSVPQTFDGVMQYVRKDGSPLWAHIIGRTIETADDGETWIWTYEDITAQRTAEVALNQAMREYAQIFDNALVGISYMHNRVILRCNRRLEEICGFAPGTLVGQNARVFYASDEAYRETARRVASETHPVSGFSGDLHYRHQAGHMIWVRVNGRPVRQGEQENWIWTHQDVTQEHEAGDLLRRSHAELEQRVSERTDELRQQLHFVNQLIEAIPGPVFYKDRDGRYLGCNKAYADFIGIAPADLLGKTVYDIAPRDLADRYKAADDALFANPGVQVYESRVKWHTGGLRDVMFHKATFARIDGGVGGIVGVMLDITERKAAEEALEENREKYRALSEAAFEAIFISENGRCIEQNKRAELMFGYSPDEAVGRMGTEWIAAADRDRVMANMVAGSELPYEAQALRKDGTTFPAMIRARLASYKGRTVRITSLNDITDRKLAEQALEQTKHEVDALNASLEQRIAAAIDELETTHHSLIAVHDQLTQAETMASLGRMVAVIAHELNTPIGNSRLAASTLRERAHEFSAKMKRGVRRSDLDGLLDAIETGTHLLDAGLQRAAHLISSFKQIAVDQTSSQRRTFLLDGLIDEIATTMEPGIRRSGCALTWNIEPGIELDSYPGPLGHVLINLIDNALRHAFVDRAPGSIVVSACSVDAAGQDAVELRVSDNGVGIPPADQKHVFKPFFTTQMGRGGTGLGLSIAYNIVTGVLCGRIAVSSETGLGGCFEVVLPKVAREPPTGSP